MRVTYCKIIMVLKEKCLTWQQLLRARNRNPKVVQYRMDSNLNTHYRKYRQSI